MAKKKPTPPEEGPKPRRRSRPRPADEAGPGSLPPSPEPERPRAGPARARRKAGPSPLERAEELAARAAEADDPRRAVTLAREALALSEDCAEAYFLLAGHARTRK